jgi:hypothetical protein
MAGALRARQWRIQKMAEAIEPVELIVFSDYV